MKKTYLLGLGILFFAIVFLVRIGEDMVDFEVNYRAASRLLAGESLYQTSDGHFMFKYFPFAALLYVPLSFLPMGVAKAVWYAITVGCSVALFVLSKRLTSDGGRLPWYLVALPPVVLAKFFFRELKLGQINTLVTLLLLWMLWELLRERNGRAGALWGLACAVKPYGFIFLPYFLLRGRFTSLLSGIGALSAAFALPSLFYGWEKNLAVHREWYETLSHSTPAQLAVADNVSIVGFFAKWTGDPMLATRLATAVVILLGLVVLFLLVWGRSLPRAAVLEVAALLLMIPLVSPLGWDYQLLTSVLTVTLLARHWTELGRAWQWLLGSSLFVAGFSIYDVIGRPAYRTFMAWSVLTVCFLVVLASLASLRARRLS